ncbi:tetratricopeptide repeat protein [Pseudomonas sp. GM49]|uniref:tetratricopeptide repeat protein n=1 Tax=Pseudomonas sp. GM49 TaxID=1144331 RepID=UPI0009DB59A1
MRSAPPSSSPDDPIDQFNFGVRYTTGFGVTQDNALAARWYRKAGQQGHAVAQSNLGVCYVQGVGVPADASLAVFWSLKAGVQGEVTAQCNLGYFYHSGTGSQSATR